MTRPGSLFHPLPPAPTFIGGWSAIGAIDAIYRAFGEAVPESVPASSGGDICSLVWWGRRSDGEPWADGSPYPVDRGRRRAVTARTRSCTSRNRPPGSPRPRCGEPQPLARRAGRARLRLGRFGEIPWRNGPRPEDSAARGRGVHLRRRSYAREPRGPRRRPLRSSERRRARAARRDTHPVRQGHAGGSPGGKRARARDGRRRGFGEPSDRDPAAVFEDIREGHLTEARARLDYPQAFS